MSLKMFFFLCCVFVLNMVWMTLNYSRAVSVLYAAVTCTDVAMTNVQPLEMGVCRMKAKGKMTIIAPTRQAPWAFRLSSHSVPEACKELPQSPAILRGLSHSRLIYFLLVVFLTSLQSLRVNGHPALQPPFSLPSSLEKWWLITDCSVSSLLHIC